MRGSVCVCGGGGGGLDNTGKSRVLSISIGISNCPLPLFMGELGLSWKMLDPAPCNLGNSSSLEVHHWTPSVN